MNRQRIIVVGDIHGMFLEFQKLLEKCDFVPKKDRLILCGDLVDRGPNSAEVVALAMEVGAEMVMGNHDEKYVRYRRHIRRAEQDWNYKIPMSLDAKKKKIWKSLTDDHLDYLEKSPYYIQLPEYNFVVVHAGVVPKLLVQEQNKNILTHVRYVDPKTHKMKSLGPPPDFAPPPGTIHWTEIYDASINVVYGHDVQSLSEPIVRTNSLGARTVGIDTGAVFGGHLTALVLSEHQPTGIFVQVESKRIFEISRLS